MHNEKRKIITWIKIHEKIEKTKVKYSKIQFEFVAQFDSIQQMNSIYKEAPHYTFLLIICARSDLMHEQGW